MFAISTWNPAGLVGTYVSARLSYAWIITSVSLPATVARVQYGSLIGKPEAKNHGVISCSFAVCPWALLMGPEEFRKSQNTRGMLWRVCGSNRTSSTPGMLPLAASSPTTPWRLIVWVTRCPVRSGEGWSPAWVLDTLWKVK